MTTDTKYPFIFDSDVVGECAHVGDIIAALLKKGTLFLFDGEVEGKPCMFIAVNCNDLFAWACADCEYVDEKGVVELWKEVCDDPKWGSTRWSCLHRGQPPQKPIRERMKAEGAWCERMAALMDGMDDD